MEEIHSQLNLSEEVVFDEMVNEVSIVDDEQNRNQQNLIQIQSTSSSDGNINQFIQQTIKSPNPSGQVTSIRNVTPNKNNQTKSASKVINNIVLTPKSQLKTRSQTATPSSTSKSITIPTSKQSPSQSIAITNNQQIFHKVIMTTGGQQLLITSPVKQGPTTRTSDSSTNNQEKQLIGLVPISPAKQTNKSTTTNQSNVAIRSKPANITIQSPTNQADKQPQYQIIRLVSATSNTSNTTNSITTTGLKQITGTQAGSQKVLIPASALKSLNASQLLNHSGNTSGGTQFLMYTPTQLIQPSPASTPTTPKQVTFSANTSSTAQTSNTRQSYVPILPNPSTVINNSTTSTGTKILPAQKSIQNGPKGSTATNVSLSDEPPHQLAITASTSTATGPSNRPRKPCNCTRSQCLKLYCDCFANGEFCSNCNCINCFNNLDHEENRQKAIKQCLERNPHAFHPKIGKGKTTAQEGIERRHTKGCNCRRSGCLKNYCECYEAKILCTDLCKCCACKNYEDSYERKSLMHLVDAVDIRSSLHGNASGGNFVGKENDPLWSNEFRPKLPVPFVSNRLLSCSFITNDLVDATTQCLIAQAEKSQKLGLSAEEAERAIIEEFGGCLTQIIEVASKEKQK